jgi:hypothetical protein
VDVRALVYGHPPTSATNVGGPIQQNPVRRRDASPSYHVRRSPFVTTGKVTAPAKTERIAVPTIGPTTDTSKRGGGNSRHLVPVPGHIVPSATLTVFQDRGCPALPPNLLDRNWETLLPSDRTPVNYLALQSLLQETLYDPTKTNYLIDGFRDGFRLRMDRSVEQACHDRLSSKSKFKFNHKSATDKPQIVVDKIVKEVQAKRMIGPFPKPIFRHYIISPLGLVKKKQQGKFRVIHDLSSPFKGVSVNSTIPKEAGAVSYHTVDTAVRLIRNLGPGCVLIKTDIEHAYKNIPIHPLDIPALGVKWDSDWFWDCTLPMGARSGCAIFEAFSTAIQHIAERKGCGDMCHILDDFLLVVIDDGTSLSKLQIFLDICQQIGVPMVQDKTESGFCLIFMGIELDSINMQARLPQDKLAKALKLVRTFQSVPKLTVQQLESLVGVLNFACSVVAPGRPFLGRLHQMLRGRPVRIPHLHLRLTRGAKEDLKMWESFLHQFNGVSMFLPNDPVSASSLGLYFHSSDKGLGICFNNQWVSIPWPQEWLSKKPLTRPLLTVLIAVEVFHNVLRDKRVALESSDPDLKKAVNAQSHKDAKVMVILRDLVLRLLRSNIYLTITLSPLPNQPAVFLSDLQVQEFREVLPLADLEPFQVPPCVHPSTYMATSNHY